VTASDPRQHPRQVENNLLLWQGGNHVAVYANRQLRPVEVEILLRYREALSGRVLEIGCGAGRILGYLVSLGGDVHGIDISERMVARCRESFPGASVQVGDMRDLRANADGQFDAILLLDSILDVVDDATRRSILDQVRGLLSADGLVIVSSHNLAAVDAERGRPGPVAGGTAAIRKALDRPLAEVISKAATVARRARNKRRLRPLEYRAADHAVLNDPERDFGSLHYYIRRDDQERQLAEQGFELVECLDVEGKPVPAGADGEGPWLHYVARPDRGPR
jgi:SAM-dependent methyltransferase